MGGDVNKQPNCLRDGGWVTSLVNFAPKPQKPALQCVYPHAGRFGIETCARIAMTPQFFRAECVVPQFFRAER